MLTGRGALGVSSNARVYIRSTAGRDQSAAHRATRPHARATDSPLRSQVPAQETDKTDAHIFMVVLQISDAREPDEYAVRIYGDTGLE